jgi:hypothetical protein
MLANFDLNHLLTFPIKEKEDRKQFLIGALVYLSSFIIPLLPLILVTGYAARIIRQILAGEQPRMVAWDDWGGMLTDGARIFGVRLVIMLPFLLLMCPFMGLSFALPFLMENASSDLEWLVILIPVFFIGAFLILVPLILIASFVLPAAEIHVVEKNEFGAAFRVREWWPVFRANLGGFLLALAITYAISFAMSIIMQFAMLTFVLICLLPFFIPVTGVYMMLVLYAAFAQAYKGGLDRLATEAISGSK